MAKERSPKELSPMDVLKAVKRDKCPVCGKEIYHNGTFPEKKMTVVETSFECSSCNFSVSMEIRNPSWMITDISQ